ncbi:MAG TPA: potassium channel family protein [Thermoanaerobaculia bacterium]
MARPLLAPPLEVVLEGARIVLGIFGVVLILGVVFDVLWTTLRMAGAGPLTSWVTNLLWHLALRVTPSHRALSSAGFLIVLLTVFLWIGLVWLGWILVLGIDPGSVVNSQSGQPADFWARTYFAGFTLITLGNGDFVPNGAVWQVLTPVAAANGFFLVTLVITYLLPLMSAALQRRQLAVHINTLGKTPQEFLLRAWDGQSFGRLTEHLLGLTFPIMGLGEGHLAYPVLHCFHSSERETAMAPNIAVLDEVLTLLESVALEQRPNRVAIYPLRGAIDRLLSTLADAHLEPERNPPPLPDLKTLRAAGIPTIDDETFRFSLEVATDRRRLLFGLVEKEGWHWDDVVGRPPADDSR